MCCRVKQVQLIMRTGIKIILLTTGLILCNVNSGIVERIAGFSSILSLAIFVAVWFASLVSLWILSVCDNTWVRILWGIIILTAASQAVAFASITGKSLDVLQMENLIYVDWLL